MRSDDRDGRYDEGVVIHLPEPASTVAADPDPDSDESGPDDSGLWRELRTGDEESFRDLLVRHGRAVYNFAFRRTGSWSVAEDVAQSTFTTVWRRAVAGDLAVLRLPSARPILFAIARKEAANQLRSARRQARLAARIAADRDVATADNTDAWLAAESAMRQINESLQVLPQQQREVIALVRWSGLSLAEAAESLGVPVGTVKSRLNRAHRRLSGTPLAGLLKGGPE
ncbi:RNA polymerase sigma factor [Microlunatus speluncae]|uniref:RNA polymerase sigma factor n=1 Tax=Microlunatus speluncae TaxID=2594267 RepID=UPI001C2DE305|nr:RNA polymerase sigma factor [Microlunatus speluncae]